MSFPSAIFKHEFTLKNIKKAFEGKISLKSTRGLDKVNLKSFDAEQELKIIYRKCSNSTYRFTPFVQKLISKGKGVPPREISVPTIRDRITLYLIKETLHQIFPNSVNTKLPNNYIKDLRNFYELKSSKHLHYIKTDIKTFYDAIPHKKLIAILKKKIKSKKLLKLIESVLKTPTVPHNYSKNDVKKYKRIKGVPQGLSISNILASIYLNEFDKKMSSEGEMYIRYVDDILIVAKKSSVKRINRTILNELAELGLSVNESKTDDAPITKPHEMLGYSISSTLTSIKDSNKKRFITAIAAKISSYHYKNEERKKKSPWLTTEIQNSVFIEDLNEKITGAISDKRRYGWLFYFSEITDMALLRKIDKVIAGLFTRLNEFDNKAPNDLKRLSKAYYKIKNSPSSGYIHQYKKYGTIAEKMKYLEDRGYLNPASKYDRNEVLRIFDRVRQKNLAGLILDVGFTS